MTSYTKKQWDATALSPCPSTLSRCALGTVRAVSPRRTMS
ncbi:hypothetical protein GBAR_LOCUS23147 [Geodia barretti]|uniref:Uncharacterized protein n=1 Tax=Geodia barretti TaxID=519541 RepID=A0AA35X1D0_GEOBA|nr:hypothetical protein GBAR_LOCUS23147 [Geodia barretti]